METQNTISAAVPCAETQNSSKPARARRPRESKITNLPEDIRELLNQKIRAHVPAKHIITTLAEHGHPGITHNNINRWSKSGYKDWLLQRQSIEALGKILADVDKHMDELGPAAAKTDRFNRLLFSVQMTQAIRDFDPNVLKQRLAADPAEYYRIARATHNHSLERYRDQRIDILQKKLGIDRPLGATKEGHEAIKIAFGLPESWPPPQISPNRAS